MKPPALVITCEHGGNLIPAAYAELFEDLQALLETHRGYDPGALAMAEMLATAFDAPLLSSTVSRLLVDLNRSVGNRSLHGAAVRTLSAATRQDILSRHYLPYRAQAEALVRQAVAEYGAVIHLSSHSFTPELDGQLRRADVGLLYDPRRSGEVDLCARWKTSLQACTPGLVVRRNYPYAGKGDGLTRWFRRHLPPDAYVGIELEINQKHVFEGGRPWAALRKVIVESLRQALAPPGRGTPV